MSGSASTIVRVAVPSPLRRMFDYLPPENSGQTQVRPGARVRVSFGHRNLVAVVVEVTDSTSVPRDKLKRIREVIDEQPLLGPREMDLACWAIDYYHHAPGEVFEAMLPTRLRRGDKPELPPDNVYTLSYAGQALEEHVLQRAPRQRMLWHYLKRAARPCRRSELAAVGGSWQDALRRMLEKGWIEEKPVTAPSREARITAAPTLNEAQRAAVAHVTAMPHRFSTTLLDGVTGSGKTEVYLACIERAAKRQQQSLVLLPEIGLTPQAVERYRQRLGDGVYPYHSGLKDSERLATWLAARSGTARVVVGTRSAVFLPFAALGLVVVDEEHDPSFKQQEGFRYSARDLAIVRGQQAKLPVLLGSATPSLESLENVNRGRFQAVHLPERAANAKHPEMRILDVRSRPMQNGISDLLHDRIKLHLDTGGQVLLFLNRRGFAPVLTCHACGWVAECPRCDARMTVHRKSRQIICHHCGKQGDEPSSCPQCGGPALEPMGKGTERLEEHLRSTFPDVGLARIDRDTTRRKGELERLLGEVRQGKTRLLVGTQMLAKGHDFPGVSLVGIVNADQGLFGLDLRASERLAQVIIQVAGRAGRADRHGEVVIQTHHPEHALLRGLVDHGYARFAAAALEERRQSAMPPFAALALFRAEATDANAPTVFLDEAAKRLANEPGVDILGPAPAPMARRAGQVRMQLLLRAADRVRLNRVLGRHIAALETLPGARRVRWSLDVDPLELF